MYNRIMKDQSNIYEVNNRKRIDSSFYIQIFTFYTRNICLHIIQFFSSTFFIVSGIFRTQCRVGARRIMLTYLMNVLKHFKRHTCMPLLFLYAFILQNDFYCISVIISFIVILFKKCQTLKLYTYAQNGCPTLTIAVLRKAPIRIRNC